MGFNSGFKGLRYFDLQ